MTASSAASSSGGSRTTGSLQLEPVVVAGKLQLPDAFTVLQAPAERETEPGEEQVVAVVVRGDEGARGETLPQRRKLEAVRDLQLALVLFGRGRRHGGDASDALVSVRPRSPGVHQPVSAAAVSVRWPFGVECVHALASAGCCADTAAMATNLDRVTHETQALPFLIELTSEERDALIRILLCVEDNWSLEPVEELILVRLQMLDMPRRLRAATEL